MSEATLQSTGFDAPVAKVEDDHLNRWPLARQIYNVAANGPADWSARIGVYGEWGTGKTSVLKFVASMAERDEHIVVWFDPWGYSSKTDLWHAFVIKCCDTIEEKVGGVAAVGNVRRKSYFKKSRDLLAKVANKVPGDPGSAVSGGLDLLTGAFSFGPEDLEKLRADLKGKRVFVLVDDLDRTAAELVPEILYALKEVLDIPGFSFVCGFDPAVVGEVLGEYHKGFGDGLKFLEKIIDYPVWLPLPTTEGLTKIALADCARYCDFVPEEAMRDVLDLLPQNPRAVRQFVRLATLLRDQTARHSENELRWPVILTANAIKTRFPRLAPSLFASKEFFDGIGMRHTLDATTKSGNEVDRDIEKHIENCFKHGPAIDGDAKEQLQKAMRRICRHINLWFGTSIDTVVYQTRIAESPRAVTEKEFDGLLAKFAEVPTTEALCEWIRNHARDQSLSETAVAGELVSELVGDYLSKLKAADEVFASREKPMHRRKAKIAFQLLEALLVKVSDEMPNLKSRDWLPLDSVIEPLSRLTDAVQPVHRELWPRTERLLKQLVRDWPGPVEKVLRAVRTIDPRRVGWIDGKEQRRFGRSLNEMLDDRLARDIARRFAEVGFVETQIYRRGEIADMRGLLLDIDGALWTAQRGRVIAVLKTAKSKRTVQENAYALLDWLNYLFNEQRGSHEEKLVRSLAADSEVMPAIWNAATARPFEGRHAHRIKTLPKHIQESGGTVIVPDWWEPAIEKALSVYQKQADANKAVSSE